jgi:hypothetical protein
MTLSPALPGWRRRFGRWCSVLLAAEVMVFGFLAAGVHGWIVPLDRPVSTDFVSFYAAGRLADSGAPALAYDPATLQAAEEAATEPGAPHQFFYYPPVFLLLAAPLARLPYLAAFVTFQAASLGLLLLALRRIAGPGWTVPALAFPATFWTLGLGQNAFLSAALFGGGLFLLQRRPMQAGLLLGALCYKPQLALFVPVALAAGGHWRALTAAASSAAALVGASLAAFGAATWLAFLDAFAQAPALYQSGRIDFSGMVTVAAAARLLGAAAPPAGWMQGAALAVAACVVAWGWRRGTAEARPAILLAATAAAAPLLLLYDLMLAGLAAAFLVRRRRRLAPAEGTVLATVFLLPLLSRPLAQLWGVQTAPLVAWALVSLCAVRAAAPVEVP